MAYCLKFQRRDGCGKTKACLFKPLGCDPNLDCTIGLVFFVVGPNKLRVEMVATSLIPTVQQQYIAIGFSDDPLMGEDMVTECVMSDMGQFAGWEPEVFVSYNHGKANDRIFLNEEEHRTLFSNISSQVIDGRLVCHFTRQIIPKIDNKNGLVGSLDKDFYVMAATGSAQPDEVNAHDMNHGSHFYPIVSSARINPSQVGEIKYNHLLDTNMIQKQPATNAKPSSSTPTVSTSSNRSDSETENSSTSSISVAFAIIALLNRLL
ncbi:hypothetical protein DICVIV_04603 [Dictyocaulus viviparus]|uniref:DOMON domain-containing protein n=1 Tax=Dictyocaulus viviparus TaxID=29172 RepID=A0A0D8Y3Z5_DICVI|nr:hypothetical protein DICVIV_04603 [Dictyocaulus viviparus]